MTGTATSTAKTGTGLEDMIDPSMDTKSPFELTSIPQQQLGRLPYQGGNVTIYSFSLPKHLLS